jgi:hypothetical protein
MGRAANAIRNQYYMALPWTRPESENVGVVRGRLATALVAIALLGLALRLSSSSWPLWNDEIWSLQNLERIRHFWQIFWGISHDNNHSLNSLWLFFANPVSENPTWLRAPSIICGALTVLVMGDLGARRSPAAAVCAASLTACSFFFTLYSVEARGYAGAILATALAYSALERAIDKPDGGSRFTLAAVVGLGLFCHLLFAVATALFGLVALLEIWRRRRNLRAAVAISFKIFWPTMLAAIPAIACFLAGFLTIGFTMGGKSPFTFLGAAMGAFDLVRLVFGLPDDPALIMALVLGASIAVGFAPAVVIPRERRIAYSLFLFALPVGVLVLRPPNAMFARYYFSSAVFLALLAADGFGALWRVGGWPRGLATLALAAAMIGGGLQTRDFLDDEKHSWFEALATILASGQTRLAGVYIVDRGQKFAYFGQDSFNQHEIYYFNEKHSPPLELASPESYCARPPSWLILGNASPDPRSKPRLELPGGGCTLDYEWKGVFAAADVARDRWALYRLAGIETPRDAPGLPPSPR